MEPIGPYLPDSLKAMARQGSDSGCDMHRWEWQISETWEQLSAKCKQQAAIICRYPLLRPSSARESL